MKLWWTLVVAGAVALGCDDSSDPAGETDGSPADAAPQADTGMGGDGGMGGDIADPDTGVDPDMAVETDGPIGPDPDMAVEPDVAVDPDMSVILPDMAPPEPDAAPLADAGMECVEDDECGENSTCHEGACRYDLRPLVFRLDQGDGGNCPGAELCVNEPGVAAPELTAALRIAVAQRALNLMFEPGFYAEDGSYPFYVGNGTLDGGAYDFIASLPIQNFIGHWRRGEAGARWVMDGDSDFNVVVPGGQIEDENGEMVTCFVNFSTTVHMEFWLTEDEEGGPVLKGEATGFLLDEVIDTIVLNGINFRDFFGDEVPDLDLDADGFFDAWTFQFEATMLPVPFNGDPPNGMNRDPDPVIPNRCPAE